MIPLLKRQNLRIISVPGMVALAAVQLIFLIPGVSGQDIEVEIDSLTVGEPAPTFAIPMLGSSDYVWLRDYAGELRQQAVFKGATRKVVIISFFASWCVPCAKEMPELLQIVREYEGKDLQVLFIATGEDDETIQEWLEEHPDVQGTVLIDRHGRTAERYGAITLPRTFVIDKEGIIILIERGYHPESYRTNMTEVLDSLLGPMNQQEEIPP